MTRLDSVALKRQEMELVFEHHLGILFGVFQNLVLNYCKCSANFFSKDALIKHELFYKHGKVMKLSHNTIWTLMISSHR